jgi:glycosyltransferase involved in cell wall biosynthesis
MKILFVQHMDGISGSELYLLQLLPELKKRGHEVEMLIAYKENTGKNEPFVNQLAKPGILTHQLYGQGPLSLKLLFRIKRIVKEGNFDIVQSNLIHADLWMSLVKFFWNRKMKLISVKHGFNEAYAAKYGFNTKKVSRVPSVWVQRLSGLNTNFNIAISKGIYDLYVKGKISKASKTEVVYYGLNLSHIQDQGFNKTTADRYAVILGRLVKYKGHEYVIRAWQKVKQQNPLLKLYIVGGGNYLDALKNLTTELNLEEQVLFLGYQPNPHQLLHFAEFSIVSSVFEGFGLITLESWYHRKPVIAFDVPAFNEIIDEGKNGLLVTPFDLNMLAEKILQLFTGNTATAAMGENGYGKLQKEYSLERMASQTLEVYNRHLLNKNTTQN